MGSVHRVSQEGGVRWGIVGFCEGGKGRTGVRGVLAGGPASEPPWSLAHLTRGCGPEPGVGTLLPFVVVTLGLGLGLIVLFGALPLWLLWFASLLASAHALAEA